MVASISCSGVSGATDTTCVRNTPFNARSSEPDSSAARTSPLAITPSSARLSFTITAPETPRARSTSRTCRMVSVLCTHTTSRVITSSALTARGTAFTTAIVNSLHNSSAALSPPSTRSVAAAAFGWPPPPSGSSSRRKSTPSSRPRALPITTVCTGGSAAASANCASPSASPLFNSDRRRCSRRGLARYDLSGADTARTTASQLESSRSSDATEDRPGRVSGTARCTEPMNAPCVSCVWRRSIADASKRSCGLDSERTKYVDTCRMSAPCASSHASARASRAVALSYVSEPVSV
mmetsp:Transcript_788/g.1505  ORF Transcript_788/g.1505 Transcript_788/m.1505 type:complete len:295 (+) Transcript_788:270-1154(+)